MALTTGGATEDAGASVRGKAASQYECPARFPRTPLNPKP